MAGADWAAFATAFFNDTAKYINERKDKASEYEDKLREEAEKSKGIVEGRIQLANTAKSIASKLKSKGATEEMIRAAAASGPNGLVDLDRAFSAAETKYGADLVRQNPEIIAATSLTAEQARMSGEGAIGLDAFIEQSYGVSAPTTGSVDAGEVSIWDKMLGRNAKERVRAKLDAEMASMGYSIYDINEAAKSAEYKSLVPGAYVEYKTPKIFTQEGVADETNTLRKLVENSAVYQAADAAYEAALKQFNADNSLASNQGTPLLAASKAALDAAYQKRLDVASGILSPYVTGQAGFYGMESYQKTMAPMIDEIVGNKGFTDSLFTKAKPEEAAAPADQTKEAIPTEGEPSTAAAPEKPAVAETGKYEPTGATIDSKYGKLAVATNAEGEKVLLTTAPLVAADGTVVPAGTPVPVDVVGVDLDAMERAGELEKASPDTGADWVDPTQVNQTEFDWRKALKELKEKAFAGEGSIGGYGSVEEFAKGVKELPPAERVEAVKAFQALDIDMRKGYTLGLDGRLGTDLVDKTSIADLSEMSGSGMQDLPPEAKMALDMRKGYKKGLMGRRGGDLTDKNVGTMPQDKYIELALDLLTASNGEKLRTEADARKFVKKFIKEKGFTGGATDMAPFVQAVVSKFGLKL